MFKSVVSARTALEATETTKKLIDSLTVPQGVTKIVGVIINMMAAMAGSTTLESISGIVELESDDMTGWGGTQTFMSPCANGNGAGWVGFNPFIYPTDIKVNGGGHIKISATGDLALTINPSCRVGILYE